MKGFHPRRRQMGTDDFPFRQAIGIALLVGLVALAPSTFSGFFHTVLNKAFQGISQDSNACFLSCAEKSPQAQQRAVLLKSVNAYPLAGACAPNAPARPGSIRPAAKTCQTAKTACAKQHRLSDAGAICRDKGWPVAPGVKSSDKA